MQIPLSRRLSLRTKRAPKSDDRAGGQTLRTNIGVTGIVEEFRPSAYHRGVLCQLDRYKDSLVICDASIDPVVLCCVWLVRALDLLSRLVDQRGCPRGAYILLATASRQAAAELHTRARSVLDVADIERALGLRLLESNKRDNELLFVGTGGSSSSSSSSSGGAADDDYNGRAVVVRFARTYDTDRDVGAARPNALLVYDGLETLCDRKFIDAQVRPALASLDSLLSVVCTAPAEQNAASALADKILPAAAAHQRPEHAQYVDTGAGTRCWVLGMSDERLRSLEPVLLRSRDRRPPTETAETAAAVTTILSPRNSLHAAAQLCAKLKAAKSSSARLQRPQSQQQLAPLTSRPQQQQQQQQQQRKRPRRAKTLPRPCGPAPVPHDCRLSLLIDPTDILVVEDLSSDSEDAQQLADTLQKNDSIVTDDDDDSGGFPTRLPSSINARKI